MVMGLPSAPWGGRVAVGEGLRVGVDGGAVLGFVDAVAVGFKVGDVDTQADRQPIIRSRVISLNAPIG